MIKAFKVAAVSGAFIGLFSLPTVSAAADDYPNKPVELVVAWAAGGATDLVARAIQPVLSEELGANIYIKNMPGAGGTIGTTQVAKAKPDGYSLLLSPAGAMAVQPLIRKTEYDVSSFDVLGQLAVVPILTMASKKSNINSLGELLEAAKANPGVVKAGTLGAGSTPDIVLRKLQQLTDVKMKAVPFVDAAKGITGLLGGFIDIYSDQAQLATEYDVTPIVLWSEKPDPAYPGVPTMIESGYDFTLTNWQGLFAPKNLDPAVREKLEAALEATLKNPTVKKNLENLKLTVDWKDSQDFSNYLDNYTNAVKEVVGAN